MNADQPAATFSRAPGLDTLNLVAELRKILAKPDSGIEAAQRIEQHVEEVILSHMEGDDPTIQWVTPPLPKP